jgi:hypothetical protein
MRKLHRRRRYKRRERKVSFSELDSLLSFFGTTHSPTYHFSFFCLLTAAQAESKRPKKKVKTETADEPIAVKEWPEIDKKKITAVTREILTRLVSV